MRKDKYCYSPYQVKNHILCKLLIINYSGVYIGGMYFILQADKRAERLESKVEQYRWECLGKQ